MGVRHWRTTALVGATALIAAAALAGCSAGDDSTSQSEPAAAGGAPAPEFADRDQAEKGTATEAKAPDLRVDQRSIIYKGSITVRVEDVNQAAAKATAIASGAGGFVGGDKRNSGSGAADATLELRVPADKFATVVDQLAGLGKEEQRGISTDDVTEETLDLDARIATQEARVASGRRLLAQAKTLNDLVMLESELAKREADLASLSAKKRRLADLTALSTITAVLLDPEAVTTSEDDSPAGFLGGLKGGWDALVASLAVLLTVIGALLPWLIAIGLPLWGALWLIRRFGRKTPRTVHAFAAPAAQLPPYPPRGPAPQHPAHPTTSASPQSAPPAAQPTAAAPPTAAQPTAAQPTQAEPVWAEPAKAEPTKGTARRPGQPKPEQTPKTDPSPPPTT
jgi:hypothetical protein